MSKLKHEEGEFVGGGAVMVVEYLQSIMCKELVGKFPDNSAFDFDYTQSSIWSPLIQRWKGRDLDMEVLSKTLSCSLSPTVLQRKLNYNEDDCDGIWENESGGKCITTCAGTINRLTKIRKKGSGFSPAAAAAAAKSPRKGWAKMLLKAAPRHFKRTSKKKEICKATQLKFSHNYLGYLND